MRLAKEAEEAKGLNPDVHPKYRLNGEKGENILKRDKKKKKVNDEDAFSDKKKTDKADFKMMKKKPTSPQAGVKILGEDEMDLIDEQAKKFKNKGHLSPKPTKYFIDPKDGFVQFPDGSRYKGGLKLGNPHGEGIIIYGDMSKYEGDWVNGNS